MVDDEDSGSYHDMTIATLYRLDPDKVAAVRRAVSGMTRCPECGTLNRADQQRCDKCGAKLYPEVPDNEEEAKLKEEMKKGKTSWE
jgi:tRNA(Ile2) C34 agmatinyltransferase TiaS